MAILSGYLIYILMFSLKAQITKQKFCRDTNTGKMRCCKDFRNVSGICELCYGSFGIDCVKPCFDGFYGHGCKKECSCTSFQWCDRISGCVDEDQCINNLTGKIECCADYYRTESDSCKPCIGYFGKNCTTPCSFGYYGHGCRKSCNCSSDTHLCDAKSGCIERYSDQTNIQEDGNTDTSENNNTFGMHQLVLIAVGFIGVTSAIWIILGLSYKRYMRRDIHGKGNRNAEEHEQTDYSTNEPPYIRPENQLPTTSTDFSRMERNTQSSTKSQQNSRKKLRRSQTVLDGNGRFTRYSDDYNHLDFHKKFKTPHRLDTNQNYSKLKIMAPHRCENTNHEDHEEESSYVSSVLEDTLLVSRSNSIQIGQEEMDKQRELECIKSENESRSNEDQNNTDLPTYSNVDETCFDTSKIDIQSDSLDSADCKMDLKEKD